MIPVVTRDYPYCMRVVGIKQLKARLSEYLREVRAGEVFLVTDRDRVVAELRPPRAGLPPTGDALDQALEALAASGQVQPTAAAPADWRWRPAGAGLDSDAVTQLLDELRSDRI